MQVGGHSPVGGHYHSNQGPGPREDFHNKSRKFLNNPNDPKGEKDLMQFMFNGSSMKHSPAGLNANMQALRDGLSPSQKNSFDQYYNTLLDTMDHDKEQQNTAILQLDKLFAIGKH
ncbi:MAG: hypothetical protein ACOYK9_03475 [Chlamydiia bacterium]